MSLVATLLQVTEQLVALLETENALFNREPPRQVAATLAKNEPEKRRLVALYERGMMALRGQPVPESPERSRLKTLIEKFRQLIEENRRRLNALKLVTERLVKAIGEAAAPNKPVQTYTPNAVMRPAFRSKPVASPLALNRTV
jgi:hypothetical protein